MDRDIEQAARNPAGCKEGSVTTTNSPDAVVTIRGDEGASVLGPDNVAIALQNPGAPPTDSGNLPNLKFPFAAAHNRLQTGGWAREITARELPVATTLAGVNMRLKAGAYRELHWHKEAEWAFMLSGSACIAGVDAGGRNFIDDIGRLVPHAEVVVSRKLTENMIKRGALTRSHPKSGRY